LQHLCLQVSKDDSGRWTLFNRASAALSNRSYGCFWRHGVFQETDYEVVPMGSGGLDSATLDMVNFNDFSVEVRSSADPWFAAQQATSGTLNFGMSKEEEELLGFILLLMGTVFGVQPCIACCLAYRKANQPRKRPRHDVRAETIGMRYRRDEECEDWVPGRA